MMKQLVLLVLFCVFIKYRVFCFIDNNDRIELNNDESTNVKITSNVRTTTAPDYLNGENHFYYNLKPRVKKVLPNYSSFVRKRRDSYNVENTKNISSDAQPYFNFTVAPDVNITTMEGKSKLNVTKNVKSNLQLDLLTSPTTRYVPETANTTNHPGVKFKKELPKKENITNMISHKNHNMNVLNTTIARNNWKNNVILKNKSNSNVVPTTEPPETTIKVEILTDPEVPTQKNIIPTTPPSVTTNTDVTTEESVTNTTNEETISNRMYYKSIDFTNKTQTVLENSQETTVKSNIKTKIGINTQIEIVTNYKEISAPNVTIIIDIAGKQSKLQNDTNSDQVKSKNKSNNLESEAVTTEKILMNNLNLTTPTSEEIIEPQHFNAATSRRMLTSHDEDVYRHTTPKIKNDKIYDLLESDNRKVFKELNNQGHVELADLLTGDLVHRRYYPVDYNNHQNKHMNNPYMYMYPLQIRGVKEENEIQNNKFQPDTINKSNDSGTKLLEFVKLFHKVFKNNLQKQYEPFKTNHPTIKILKPPQNFQFNPPNQYRQIGDLTNMEHVQNMRMPRKYWIIDRNGEWQKMF